MISTFSARLEFNPPKDDENAAKYGGENAGDGETDGNVGEAKPDWPGGLTVHRCCQGNHLAASTHLTVQTRWWLRCCARIVSFISAILGGCGWLSGHSIATQLTAQTRRWFGCSARMVPFRIVCEPG